MVHVHALTVAACVVRAASYGWHAERAEHEVDVRQSYEPLFVLRPYASSSTTATTITTTATDAATTLLGPPATATTLP